MIPFVSKVVVILHVLRDAYAVDCPVAIPRVVWRDIRMFYHRQHQVLPDAIRYHKKVVIDTSPSLATSPPSAGERGRACDEATAAGAAWPDETP